MIENYDYVSGAKGKTTHASLEPIRPKIHQTTTYRHMYIAKQTLNGQLQNKIIQTGSMLDSE